MTHLVRRVLWSRHQQEMQREVGQVVQREVPIGSKPLRVIRREVLSLPSGGRGRWRSRGRASARRLGGRRRVSLRRPPRRRDALRRRRSGCECRPPRLDGAPRSPGRLSAARRCVDLALPAWRRSPPAGPPRSVPACSQCARAICPAPRRRPRSTARALMDLASELLGMEAASGRAGGSGRSSQRSGPYPLALLQVA